jgi:uncharacterized repeat protein (TIGR02543 family)
MIGVEATMPTTPVKYTIEDEVTLNNPIASIEFLGWYLDRDCSGEPVTKIEKGSTGNVILYAKWEEIEIEETYSNIIYNLNGGFMATVIYLDVLVAVNIFVTYILLVCTRVVAKLQTKKWGVVISTIIGGASSLIIFWEEMPIALSIVYKILIGIIISYSAFVPNNRKLFFKTTLAFFLVNFIFGGVMYFIEITLNINNILYINGTVYFDISVLFLVSMTLICYGLLLVGDYFLRKRASENTIYEVLLHFRNECVTLKALYDTGNHLTDGLDSNQ